MWIVSLRGSGAGRREESIVSRMSRDLTGTCLWGASQCYCFHWDVFS